jgi:hypothetical protein
MPARRTNTAPWNYLAMRYPAVGASAGTHLPLAVVEDLTPETKLEVFLGAPAGATGYVVIDIGLVEI